MFTRLEFVGIEGETGGLPNRPRKLSYFAVSVQTTKISQLYRHTYFKKSKFGSIVSSLSSSWKGVPNLELRFIFPLISQTKIEEIASFCSSGTKREPNSIIARKTFNLSTNQSAQF